MKHLPLIFFLLLLQLKNVSAQNNVGSIHLNNAPDPISTSLGGIGVATDPNETGHFWNPAKLALLSANYGGSVSYSPAQIGSMFYGTAYKQIDDHIAVGLGLNYYSLGKISLKDELGTNFGIQNPNEFGLDFAIAKKYGDNFSVGATIRYIKSAMFEIGNVGKVQSANAAAIDVGLFRKYQIGHNALNFGVVVSNIGTKLNYGPRTSKFLPMSLKTGLNYQIGQYNRLNIGLELTKLLVPNDATSDKSVVSAMFSSFNEGLKNYSVGLGTEYVALNQFMFRSGINIQNNSFFIRKQASLGIGFITQGFRFNTCYNIPLDIHPITNKFKISLGMIF